MSWNPEYEISVSDSDDDSDQLAKTYNGRECVIFVIDANLYNVPDLLENALVMLRSAFLSGLLVNDKDLIGLIFVNTKHSPKPYEYNCLEDIIMPDNCSVFLPACHLNSSIVEHFLRFVETVTEQFGNVYGISSDGVCCNFSHVLRLCLDLVHYCNYVVDNTTIVFITNKDLPHPPMSEGYRQALQKAADLKAKDVEFQVIPMIDEFNYDLFYKEFISLLHDVDIESFEPCNAERLRKMLANRKFNHNFIRRSLGHFKFSLGSNLTLSAQYFNYYQKEKRPRKVILQRTDNALVHKQRLTQVRKHNAEKEDFEEARDINIKHAWYEINLGHNCMRLSYDQVNRVRNIHSPGMVLLGFKARSFLRSTMYSKPASFMYPDEFHIEGSKRLFRGLWERCVAKDKIVICLFMCKRKSMPRYVALIPVYRDFTSHKTSILSNDGFKIVYLSCSTYIRDFNSSKWNSVENHAQDKKLAVCEKLVKKFRLDYKPDILCDPELDQLQSKLLGLAFNVKFETLGSQYFPNPDNQDQRITTIVPIFEEVFGVDKVEINKRKNSDTAHSTDCSKKCKISMEDLANKECVMQFIKAKTLQLCSKDQLFQILKIHFNKTVSKITKKQDLLDIIYSL